MRTLFIINTVGLYIHCTVILLRLVNREQLIPFAQDSDPESIQFRMYTDFVPFAVFAALGFIALWQGVGWPRKTIASLISLPGILVCVVYSVWWIGVV